MSVSKLIDGRRLPPTCEAGKFRDPDYFMGVR